MYDSFQKWILNWNLILASSPETFGSLKPDR